MPGVAGESLSFTKTSRYFPRDVHHRGSPFIQRDRCSLWSPPGDVSFELWRSIVKHRHGIYGLGVLLAMTVGCNRGTGEQPRNGVQPASAVTTTGSYEVTAIADGGAIGGTIMLSGPILKLPPRKITKDSQVCGAADRESQKLIVNGSGGLRNAVVIVEGVKRC